MNAPIPSNRHVHVLPGAIADYEKLSLEELLVALCRVGRPRLSRMSDSWFCVVEMHVATAGVEFKITSENSSTPIGAARQCAERVLATLNQYSSQPKE